MLLEFVIIFILLLPYTYKELNAPILKLSMRTERQITLGIFFPQKAKGTNKNLFFVVVNCPSELRRQSFSFGTNVFI